MQKSTTCDIRCRTAETPKEACQCSCNGANHGTTSRLTEYETESIEANAKHPRTDPFRTVKITGGGVETVVNVETIADSPTHSITDVNGSNRIDVYIEHADDGWTLHRKLSIENVRDNSVVVKKPDGFMTVVPADQIPIDQRALQTH